MHKSNPVLLSASGNTLHMSRYETATVAGQNFDFFSMLTGVGTMVLAIFTIYLYLNSRRDTRMSGFSTKFEAILELLDDTKTTLLKWHEQFANIKVPIKPSAAVPISEINSQRDRANIMRRHLELYGSRKITNLVEEWMQIMIVILDIYSSAYPKRVSTAISQQILPIAKAKKITEDSAKQLEKLNKLQEKLTWEIRRFLLAQITPRFILKRISKLRTRLAILKKKRVN